MECYILGIAVAFHNRLAPFRNVDAKKKDEGKKLQSSKITLVAS